MREEMEDAATGEVEVEEEEEQEGAAGSASCLHLGFFFSRSTFSEGGRCSGAATAALAAGQCGL